jgi:hypothetical protein
MGFRNATFNREWRISMAVRRVLEGNGNNTDWAIMNWMLCFVILPALWFQQEQEKLAKRETSIPESLTHTTVGSLPLGDLATDILFHGIEGERHSMPAEEISTADNLVKITIGQPVKQPVRTLADTAGYAGLGVPDQFGIASQYAWDVEQGNTQPENGMDFLRGLAEGAQEPRTRSRSRGRRR